MFHPGYAGANTTTTTFPRHRLRAADRLSRYPISGTQFESRLRAYPVTMTGVIAPSRITRSLVAIARPRRVAWATIILSNGSRWSPVQLTRQSRIRRIHHKFRRRHGVERLGPARQDARALRPTHPGLDRDLPRGRCWVLLSHAETRAMGEGRAPALPGAVPWQLRAGYFALVQGHRWIAKNYADRGLCSAFLLSSRPWESQGYTSRRC